MWIIIGMLVAAVTVYCTSGEKTSTPIKCRREDVYHEEPRRYSLSLTDATTCNMYCPDNCTCVLGDSVLKTTCTNETTSAEILYPDSVRFLYLPNVKLNGIALDAFTTVGHMLERLYLAHNRIETLHPDVFTRMAELEYLFLYDNKISELPSSVFTKLAKLKWLVLYNNAISVLPSDVFSHLTVLELLYLSNNAISVLPSDVFSHLTELVRLSLSNNAISVLPSDVFSHLTGLVQLSLSNNAISVLPSDVFSHLTVLEWLYLSNNTISVISLDVFSRLTGLVYLTLNNNNISIISVHLYIDLINLKEIHLNRNNLTTLPANIFQSCKKVTHAFLQYNQLRHVHEQSLTALVNLVHLNLAHNKLSVLPANLFTELVSLQIVELSFNHLDHLGKQLFRTCVNLVSVDLRANALKWTNREAYTGLNSSTVYYVTDYHSCCFIPANCSFEEPSTPFLTCNRLLPYNVLRVFIWLIAIGALIGNLSVLFSRIKPDRERNKVQNIFIANLSMSDFLMGIYLFIVLSADLYYTDFFPSHSEWWRYSPLCRLAGTLSVLSSEASVFLITLISVDRFMGIKWPFSKRRLRTKRARMVLAILWVVALILSITPSMIAGVNEDFYDVSEVCIGLPISRYATFDNRTVSQTFETGKYVNTDIWQFVSGIEVSVNQHTKSGSRVGMYFSIAMFVGLNFVSFLIVAVCYIGMFITRIQSNKDLERTLIGKDEIALAKKSAIILLTDFFCWMPIVVLSILVQSGAVTVSPVVYAWIATFVLPINSSINPFLYTLATIMYNRYEKRKRRKENSIEMRQLR